MNKIKIYITKITLLLYIKIYTSNKEFIQFFLHSKA